MKTLVVIGISLFSVLQVFAQDNIIFLNGKEEKAKVIEVNSSEIKYTISRGEAPAVFVVPRSEVFMIQFEDGQSRVITAVEKIANDETVEAPVEADEEISLLVPEEEKEPTYHQMGKRHPMLAFGLSWFVPGGGQYYNGDIAKGIVMSSLWVAGTTTVFATLLRSNTNTYVDYGTSCYIDQYGNQICDDYYYSERFTRGQKIAMGVGGGMALGSFLWSVIDAPIVAAVRNRKIDLKSKDGSASRHLIWDVSPVSAYGPGASFSLKF